MIPRPLFFFKKKKRFFFLKRKKFFFNKIKRTPETTDTKIRFMFGARVLRAYLYTRVVRRSLVCYSGRIRDIRGDIRFESQPTPLL